MATNTDAYPINTTTRAYTKGLIELRRSTDAFSKGTMAEIDERVSLVRVPEIKKTDLAIVYRATDSAGDTYFILINSDDKERHLTIPFDLSDGEIIVDAETAGTTKIDNPSGVQVDGNKVTLAALSATIIRVDKLVPVEVEYPVEVDSPVINKNGTVTFNFVGDATTESVTVAGSFNDWNNSVLAMEKGNDNVWSVTTTVQPGSYEYKFVINGGTWIADPSNDSTVGNDGNSQLIMPEEVLESRYVEFTYVRNNHDYDEWNIWVWGTGVKDDQIDFTEITEDGAKVLIEVAPGIESIGFVLRKGTDWDIKDPYGEDRSIKIDQKDLVTKVTVYEGAGEYDAIPSIPGPILDDGDATFFFRDPELFLEDIMDTIHKVELKLKKIKPGIFAFFERRMLATLSNTPEEDVMTYDMVYDPEKEYFVYTVENIPEGIYEYTYLVTYNDGEEPKEVNDPYDDRDGIATLVFEIPDISFDVAIEPAAIDYNQHAVVSITPSIPEHVKLREAYIDLSPVGGPVKVAIDLELNEHTIAVKQGTPAGITQLDVFLVDEYGNKHRETVEIEIKSRQIKDDADFDWDEARIYFMLTDRFANGDPSNDNPNGENYDVTQPETYHGGDFQGIIDNLDYLEDLGINTIWITPIVDNIDHDLRAEKEGSQYGYHGYWAQDFEKIDEHLGDIDKLKELIDSAHNRGIKIMVDVVLNHAGYDTDFKDMIRENPVDGHDQLMELDGLPDFRTEDPEVRARLIEWQVAWVTRLQELKTDNNNTIDYFRVDTVKHVDNTTWNAFKNELTKAKQDFKLIGEWYGASVNNTGDQLRTGRMDSLLDFNFKSQTKEFITGNISAIETQLADRNSKIDNTAMLGQFLSSHDENGFLYSLTQGENAFTEEEARNKFKVAAALQMTAKGQPVIYYGEEIGLTGKAAGDMDNLEFSENRYDFDWDLVNDENDMLTHYKKLLNIRADYSDVFSKGTRQHITGDDESGYSVFARTYEDKQIFVGLNTTEEAVNSTFTVDLVAGSEVIDVYNDVTYTVAADGTVEVNIPGNVDGGTVILVPAGPETPGPSINDRLDVIRDSLNNLKDAVEKLPTENPAIIEELNSIWAEYDRLRESGDATDAGLDALAARIAALLAIVDDTEPDAGSDSTDEEAEEDDGLPPTGETNNLMIVLFGLVFIGGGTALAFTFKKKERTD